MIQFFSTKVEKRWNSFIKINCFLGACGLFNFFSTFGWKYEYKCYIIFILLKLATTCGCKTLQYKFGILHYTIIIIKLKSIDTAKSNNIKSLKHWSAKFYYNEMPNSSHIRKVTSRKYMPMVRYNTHKN